MIKYIKGAYAMTTENGIIVETPAGIGFEINLPVGSPLYRYTEGEIITVYTEFIVREDSMSLYGFHNKESLSLFRMLMTVSGIGPKGALAILSSMSSMELIEAIAFGDVKKLSKANGVGKKTAERLVLELKDKIGTMSDDEDNLRELRSLESAEEGDAKKEAVSALIALGYSKQEASMALSKVKETDLSSEEYIKRALKNLF